MSFANPRNEGRRLLVLSGLAVSLEFAVLPLFAKELQLRYEQWPFWSHLFVTCMPRLFLMAVLVVLLGPFQRRAPFNAFVALYAVFMFIRFKQSELYINWEYVEAAAGATVPYVAGLVGIAIGFLARRVRTGNTSDVR